MTVRWIQTQTTVRGFRWLGQNPACDESKAKLAEAKNHRDQIQAYLVDLNAARIEAYQNGDTAQGQFLDAQYAGQQQALIAANANVSAAQTNVDTYCNAPPPSGNAPPAPGCSDTNPCPPDQECVNGQCMPLCGPGMSRNPISNECEANQPSATKSSAGGVLGVALLVAAALGAIYFGVLAPQAGRSVP